MPRNGSGVMSKPAGTTAVANTTIESAKFNQVVDDIIQDLNDARPVSAGGTGGTSAAAARSNLGTDASVVLASKSTGYSAVPSDNNAVLRFSAAATLSLAAAATLGASWHCWVVADGGAVVIDPNGSETVDGSTTVTLPNGYACLLICDGTGFRTDKMAFTLVSALAAKADNVQPPVSVASASTTDIGAAASQSVTITGTTTITSLGTAASGTLRRVVFAGALTLTHNSTSLILPGAANIVTVAGDTATFLSEGGGNWRCIAYQRTYLQGMVRVHTANGYGSTNTTIRRFSTVVAANGSDITYADSASLGASFTINNAGVYAISYSDSTSNASGMSLGISLNSNQLTTDIQTITAANRLVSANTPSTANYRNSVATTVYLSAGDVIRAHADGSGGGGAQATFTITRVA